MTALSNATLNNPNSDARNMCDLIVDYLAKLDVEYVFGVPGAHIAALYEALERSEKRGGPRAILTRHESGAATMADGYARETGRLGVCCATTGPGATNILTGVASSYADHTPLLVITGQTPLPQFGMAAFQESSPDRMDTTAMLSHCTNYSSVVTDRGQLENKLSRALMIALRSRPGPVHLSLPVDISRAPAPAEMSYPHLATLLNKPSAFIDLPALAELTDRLNNILKKGRRITILVGHECAGAAKAIMAFAELVGANIVTTQRGKTRINPYHPLVRGVFGYAGHQSAREALVDDSVDLILAAGTGLGQWSTSSWDKALLNGKMVHIHPMSEYFSRSPMARLHVHGTVTTVFEQLRTGLISQGYEPKPALFVPSGREGIPPQIEVRSIAGYQCQESPIHPQRLVWELMQAHFPANTRFIVDTTNWLPWTLQYFFTPQPENYRLSSELAAMGWGLGACVGTALGAPGIPVVCLVGDGGFLMNGQEITVAVQERLPVIYIILNDGGYGMVKHRHRQVSDEAIEFGFPRVDFSMMAKAMGANGYKISHLDQLKQLDFQAICHSSGPTVLDIMIDPEVTPPMGMF